MSKSNKDIDQLKFEQAIKELETIINELEKSDSSISLEESLELYKEGVILAGHCKKILDNTEQEINILKKTQENKFEESSFKEE